MIKLIFKRTDIKTFLDKACIFQNSKEGRMFCEFSATQLRLLQHVYHNNTSTGSDVTRSTEELYIMPKLQMLLSVLKKYGNSQNSGKLFKNAW